MTIRRQLQTQERTSMKEMVGGCCVCSDERGWAENPLVYCDGQGCNVAVHQACYGIVQVPTGPWFCRKCESQERAARVRCELCPSKDGALKHTDNSGWAHVVCALYIPEVRFGNVTTMEPIILQLVPQDRYNKSCYICEEQGMESKATIGACMQCNKSGCKQYFHVTCAQAAGLLCEEAGNYLDNVKYCGYCHYHYQKLKKDSNIKTIPAFKPIPADNATPEPSPEKHSPPRPEAKDKGRGRGERKSKSHMMSPTVMPSAAAAPPPPPPPPPSEVSCNNENAEGSSAIGEVISISQSDNSNASSCNLEVNGQLSNDTTIKSDTTAAVSSTSSIGSKFTTANFTETVITHNGSPVFGSDKHKKKKSISSNVDNQGKASQSPATQVSSSSSTPSTTTTTSSPTPTFSSMYENFITTELGSGNRNNHENQQSNKRSHNGSIEKGERKKHKKNNARSKTKNAKNITISSGDASPGSPASLISVSSNTKIKKRRHEKQPSPASTVSLVPVNQINLTSLQNGNNSPQNNEPSGKTNGPPILNVSSEQGFTEVQETAPTTTSVIVLPTRPTTNTTTSKISIRQSPEHLAPPPMPQTLDQLLERQWEQGSNFLMEQAQNFDIASLLSCLHQLRAENQRLEEHVNNLIARRDHLLAVNARLALPLNNNAYHPVNIGINNAVNPSTEDNHSHRMNNCISLESNVVHSTQKSPAPGHSPVATIGSSSLPLTPSPAPSQASIHSSNASPGHQTVPFTTSSLNTSRHPQSIIPSSSPVGQPPVAITQSQPPQGYVTSTLDLPSSLMISPTSYNNRSNQEHSLQNQGLVYQSISPPYSTVTLPTTGSGTNTTTSTPLHSLCSNVVLPVSVVTNHQSYQAQNQNSITEEER
ncbi:protein AF-10-like isoform X2 [Centruroides sculpturatus]|uniref:protein AF-10-like isoform X2 n=1 Tax=Centruroides sculpturatus TaxID=218467 RepID=UPI000C6E6175|nr:protein AF-10-like isoform X2 [Centruroides sculpturatus]